MNNPYGTCIIVLFVAIITMFYWIRHLFEDTVKVGSNVRLRIGW